MKVFQYVIMYTPNKEEKEKGEKAQFLSGTSDNPIVTLLAEDEKKAMLLANRALSEQSSREPLYDF
jgi:hypothetical protein